MTLFRATPRSIGEDYSMEGAQVLRPLTFKYSIQPHAGTWEAGGVFEQSLMHNVSMKAAQSPRYSKGKLPQKTSFLSISPSAIVMSALKKADKSDALILRLYNPTSKEIDAKIAGQYKPIKKARMVNFLEEPKGDLPVGSDGIIKLHIPHKKIMTLELSF